MALRLFTQHALHVYTVRSRVGTTRLVSILGSMRVSAADSRILFVLIACDRSVTERQHVM